MGSDRLGWPNWIGVVADDLDRQKTFYREILGASEMDASDDWAQLDMGFPNLFELLARSEAPQYDRPRFQVGFSVEDLVSARARLLHAGAIQVSDIEGGVDSGGRWSYFRDPERNAFEISQRLGSRW